MSVAFNLIVAVCENMGIGKNGNLPWRLKSEMDYFTRMTSKCTDADKRNVVIMGRKTWDSIPKKFKPLKDRINFVLSRSPMDLKDYEKRENVHHFENLSSVVKKLKDVDFRTKCGSVWVIGGSDIYDMCMKSEYFYRLYITTIMKKFECDTFFPELPQHLEKVTDERVPEGIQEEGGVQYVIHVYENPNFVTDQ